jgi:putative transposon-encoded protein
MQIFTFTFRVGIKKKELFLKHKVFATCEISATHCGMSEG